MRKAGIDTPQFEWEWISKALESPKRRMRRPSEKGIYDSQSVVQRSSLGVGVGAP